MLVCLRTGCAILDLPVIMSKPILSYFKAIAKIEARGSLDGQLGPPIKNCCFASYCKGNLTDLRRKLHLSLAKENPM
jgi:hypothetical protein